MQVCHERNSVAQASLNVLFKRVNILHRLATDVRVMLFHRHKVL